MNKLFDEDTDKDCVNQQAYREKGARQVVVALRDDQLGQLVSASPHSRRHHNGISRMVKKKKKKKKTNLLTIQPNDDAD